MMTKNIPFTNRVREALADRPDITEKNMFSGTAFIVDDKMCITVSDHGMKCGIDPLMQHKLVEKKGCSAMIMKGRKQKRTDVLGKPVFSLQ